MRQQRYIAPLIAPPTPPQIEQDKAQIDEAFNRAFALIEQLSTDTQQIKDAEETRKTRLDSAITGFEDTIQDLKDASRKRDDETRRIGDEVRNLQGMIPKAMKAHEDSSDQRLKDLGEEMKSLKRLIANRLGGAAPAASASTGRASPATNGSTSTPDSTTAASSTAAASTTDASAPRTAPTNPLDRFSSGKGGIPAWQMAAAKKNEENKAAAVASGNSVGAYTSDT